MKRSYLKPLVAALAVTTALTVPRLAMAKSVTISGEMATWRGNAAYVAIYVTDAAGNYQSTLYVAGRNARYYRELRTWYRGVAAAGRLDGVTGASVGSGRTFSVSLDIADALIDAGYEIHVDSASEHGSYYSADIVIPLQQTNSGQAFSGAGYVSSLTVQM